MSERQKPPVRETGDGDPRWALIDLLLWTIFLLIVIAGTADLIWRWISRIWSH